MVRYSAIWVRAELFWPKVPIMSICTSKGSFLLCPNFQAAELSWLALSAAKEPATSTTSA